MNGTDAIFVSAGVSNGCFDAVRAHVDQRRPAAAGVERLVKQALEDHSTARELLIETCSAIRMVCA